MSAATVALTSSGQLLLTTFGVTNPRLQRIRSGRNSRVWRVDSSDDSYVLKEYFRHPADPRDRLSTEYGFLSFLRAQGITCVPKPLTRDDTGEAALYSFQPGVTVTMVATNHIEQAAAFITLINSHKETAAAQSLPIASEACFTIDEHLSRVRTRLEILQSIVDEPPQVEQAGLRELLRDKLWPTYKRIEEQIEARSPDVAQATTCSAEQRILSPSDFGFHNVLEHEGRTYFLDFEYAGWDDPAKLLCDFASQPQIPITPAQAQLFLGQLYPEQAPVVERARLLLPLYRLKWCCILLNEFRSRDRERRTHAGNEQVDGLTTQLSKASLYFDQHLFVL